MFRNPFLIILMSVASLALNAQIYDPVTWSFRPERTGDGSYEIVFKAEIEEGSHIYAMKIAEGGPIPTSFSFAGSNEYSLVDSVYEVNEPVVKLDEAFGFNIGTFSNVAEFRQKIKAEAESFIVKGEVTYMACNNETCSPPKSVEFEVVIGDSANRGAKSGIESGSESSLPPDNNQKGLLGFFLLSLLAGFAGILTPCVFPMIPMTVAFFSRNQDSRNKSIVSALVFGLSIILIYASLGIIVSATSAGAGIANALSTHWFPNAIFFTLFVVFAISFFGAFEIQLPNKWVTSADSRVDKGGLAASFFMGLTTVIVSFSCTGPIVGALLVEAASGDVLRPTIGMFGFGLAFALPFTVFALFPAILNRMPRSGGWLNSIKVVLGFIMLAFSMKFLMTIDSVYSLGLISRDIYLSVWIVLFSLLGFYLLGKIRFAHDSELAHIGTFRMILIIFVFSFVVYLIPGLFGAPLTRLAALLPSPETSWFAGRSQVSVAESTPASGSIPSFQSFTIDEDCGEPRFGDKLKLPYGLTGYFDYEQGLKCAARAGKPVLLDFKGHACANCKLMEAKVWSDPEVLRLLKEEFIIIALYTDDRTQLPEDEWIVSEVDGKTKKTLGKINEDLEIRKFNTNAMPLYVITGHDGEPLADPMPSNFDVAAYRKWLENGLKRFREAS